MNETQTSAPAGTMPTFKISTGETHSDLRDLVLREVGSTRDALRHPEAEDDYLDVRVLNRIEDAFVQLDALAKSSDTRPTFPQIELPLTKAAETFLWGVRLRAVEEIRDLSDRGDQPSLSCGLDTAGTTNVWLRDFRQERAWETEYGGGDVTLDVPPECHARFIAYFDLYAEFFGGDGGAETLADGIIEQIRADSTITMPVRLMARELLRLIEDETCEWKDDEYTAFAARCDRMKALRRMLAQLEPCEGATVEAVARRSQRTRTA